MIVDVDLLLYHWSPTDRRKSIVRNGLLPGSRSRTFDWRPPYVCFSDSPSLAWALSAGVTGSEHPSWDLWMVWASCLNGYEVLPFDDEPDRVKEYRVYHRIYKRDLWFVGTRGLGGERESA